MTFHSQQQHHRHLEQEQAYQHQRYRAEGACFSLLGRYAQSYCFSGGLASRQITTRHKVIAQVSTFVLLLALLPSPNEHRS